VQCVDLYPQWSSKVFMIDKGQPSSTLRGWQGIKPNSLRIWPEIVQIDLKNLFLLLLAAEFSNALRTEHLALLTGTCAFRQNIRADHDLCKEEPALCM
jgi:hypothetical protein